MAGSCNSEEQIKTNLVFEERCRQGEEMEPELITLALAVAGVAAYIAKEGSNLAVRVVACTAFVLSAVSASDLYEIFLAPQLPGLMRAAFSYRGHGVLGYLRSLLYLARHWAKLLGGALANNRQMSTEDVMAESLLSLLVTFWLIAIATGFWIGAELSRKI